MEPIEEDAESFCFLFRLLSVKTLTEVIAVLMLIGALYSISSFPSQQASDTFTSVFIIFNLAVCFLAITALYSVCLWCHKGLLPLLILLHTAVVVLSVVVVAMSIISLLPLNLKFQARNAINCQEILKAVSIALPVVIFCTVIVHRCYGYLKKQSTLVEIIWQSKFGDHAINV
ncbi:hypothetical protein L596_020011 [Steinernema carpocapsae]|nr:hypothetical protein L596_020011 [Steinernema carpocapsae]